MTKETNSTCHACLRGDGDHGKEKSSFMSKSRNCQSIKQMTVPYYLMVIIVQPWRRLKSWSVSCTIMRVHRHTRRCGRVAILWRNATFGTSLQLWRNWSIRQLFISTLRSFKGPLSPGWKWHEYQTTWKWCWWQISEDTLSARSVWKTLTRKRSGGHSQPSIAWEYFMETFGPKTFSWSGMDPLSDLLSSTLEGPSSLLTRGSCSRR